MEQEREREIKFRAWDGFRMVEFSDLGIGFKKGKKVTPYIYFKMDTFNGQASLAKHKTMQFTGLTDKNGADIYEGDLFDVLLEDAGSGKITKVVGEVAFMFGGFVVRFLHQKSMEHINAHLYKFLHDKGKAVIGNIHQNPELLN